MPECIGAMHDQFIRRYLETAESRFINKQRETFVRNKKGYILQVYVYAAVVPIIESSGLKFVGFIKRVDERVHTSLIPPPAEFSTQKSILMLSDPSGDIKGLSH
jgi:hypothetical protein